MRKNNFATVDGGAVFMAPLLLYCDYLGGRFYGIDGERKFKGESFETLFSELRRILETRLRHFRKHSPELLVIVNDLNVFEVLVREYIGDAQSAGEKESFGSVHALEVRAGGFLFRNFNFIANSRPEPLCDFFGVKNPVQAMALFCEKLAGERKLYSLRWTLAYITKKAFYHDIAPELWEEMKKEQIFFHSLTHYRDMFAGNKAGALLRFDDPDCSFRRIREHISSFDKKSAYPSVFVNDDIFPLSRPIRVMKGKADALINAIQSRHWFKIVIRRKDPEPELLPFQDPDEPDLYGIEYYDFLLLRDVLGVSARRFSELLNSSKWSLYVCKHTGYLAAAFRQRIAEYYVQKEAIKDKKNFYRFTLKTQLDMMFGKAIQRKDFRSVKEVNKHYTGRGDNYLLPQHSMHAIAAVRCELMRAVKLCGDSCIAYDTDAAKVEGDGRIFKALNEEIRMKNERAGYPLLNIGYWMHEWTSERFLQLCTKSYFYELEGEVCTKHAGITDRDFRRYLDTLPENEDLFEHFQTPRTLSVLGKYCYLPDEHRFIRQVNTFEL